MKVLCVAEKPSIAKSITEILSGGRWDTRESGHKYVRNYDFSYNLPPPLGNRGYTDFTVTAVLGHLTSTDFGDDHRQWSSCDPFALFDANILTFIAPSLKSIERNLHREARNADMVMIWTDCDREGEHIGSEVVEVCRKGNRDIIVTRARFSAIIAAQIHQACREAGELDMQQADAVSARIDLDLRIGAAFTRLTTMTLQNRAPELANSVISYGPCQFPTLGFVVDQYNRVQAFVPESFWYIYVAIEKPSEDGNSRDMEVTEFKWKRNHLFDEQTVTVLYETCVDEPLATVTSVETKPTTKWKPLPLTTVELQQSGSRLLHMTPKRILDIAEKLYQRGILSYPRTETDQYDQAFDFNSLIAKQTYSNDWGQFAQKLLDGDFQRPRNGRKNDKAHPPIHPTANAGDLAGEEKRVFDLIARRFLASCHKNAEGKTTTVEIDIAGERFSTSGLVVLQRNYLEVYPFDKWASSAVPDFQEDEQFMPSVLEVRDGKTSKPNLLTEADLVGLMDKNGIGELEVPCRIGKKADSPGTDATIAEHIAKIIEREYVTEKQEQKIKYLVPSSLGVGLVEGYNAIGFDRSLSKPHLRAETEHRMQQICDGLQSKRDVLHFMIEQYKEVYLKARREFQTVENAVLEYLHGQGEAQEALRAAARGRGRGAARGARGRGAGAARGRNTRNDNNNGQDDDDDDDGEPGGGGGRGAPRGRGRGASTTGSTRGGAGAGAGRNNRGNGDGGNGADSRMCSCGTEAVVRTAGPTSKNAGRSFHTCPKPQGQQCGFFEWADEQSGGGNAQAGPSRQTGSYNNAPQYGDDNPQPAKRARTTESRAPAEDGMMRCDCDLEAKFGVASKEGPNKGRKFWTCPNSKRAQCGFFQWADDDDDGGGGGPGPGPSYGGGGASSRGRGGGGGGTDFSGPTSGECFKCGKSGHWSNACPDPGGGGGSRSNGRSKPSGGRGGGGGGGGGGANDECYKCHETGHWASACPNEESGGGGGGSRGGSRGGRGSRGTRGSGTRGRGSGSRGARGGRGGGGGGGGASGECYKCHQPGHWANACPNE